MFTLKVHLENPRAVLPPWCYVGGEVMVSYSGVALAWAHVPRFCMRKRVPVELTPDGVAVGEGGRIVGGLAPASRFGLARGHSASAGGYEALLRRFVFTAGPWAVAAFLPA